MPYLDILAARAKIALAALTPPPQRSLVLTPPAEWHDGALPLHGRLRVLLAQLCDEGAVGAGVQVCVMRHSVLLAEACAGFCGIVDGRPMLRDVPMPLLELSALLPLCTLHSLLAGEGYASHINPAWPGCAAAGAAGYTVGDALCHRVPLEAAGAWQVPVERVASLRAQFDELSAKPLRLPAAMPAASAAADTSRACRPASSTISFEAEPRAPSPCCAPAGRATSPPPPPPSRCSTKDVSSVSSSGQAASCPARATTSTDRSGGGDAPRLDPIDGRISAGSSAMLGSPPP